MAFAKMKDSDTEYKETCCDYLAVDWLENTLFCEKHNERLGTLNNPRECAKSCLRRKQNPYCVLEKEKADAERQKAERERAERERVERERVEKLRAAAEQGDANAQYELGCLYISGQGVWT